MSLTKFDNIIRSALWASYNNTCFYCNKNLDWNDVHIDHVIPESLANNQRSFDTFKVAFDLDKNFDVNELYNLVPVHGKCNLRKNDELFAKQTILFYLGLTKRALPKITQEIEKLKRRKNKGQIISKVQTALATNLIDIKELQRIINQAQQNNWNIKEVRLPLGVEFIDEVYDSFYFDTDISTLINKKLLVGGIYDYLKLVNDINKETKVSTLSEWRWATCNGFYPLTNADLKMSFTFIFFDELIKALQIAKMPKISFISEPWEEINNLDLLSPSIFHDFGAKFNKYTQQRFSVGDLVRKGIITVNESQIYTISLEFDGMEISLIEQFRADFNNDGIEDIFVSGWTRVVGGTLGYGFTTFLTRYSDKHLIEKIK